MAKDATQNRKTDTISPVLQAQKVLLRALRPVPTGSRQATARKQRHSAEHFPQTLSGTTEPADSRRFTTEKTGHRRQSQHLTASQKTSVSSHAEKATSGMKHTASAPKIRFHSATSAQELLPASTIPVKENVRLTANHSSARTGSMLRPLSALRKS